MIDCGYKLMNILLIFFRLQLKHSVQGVQANAQKLTQNTVETRVHHLL